jgi:adenylate kinase
LRVFHTQTAPLKQHYQALGLLVGVDGMGSPDEVFARVCAALDSTSRGKP